MDKANKQNSTLFKLFLMVSIINLGFSIYMKSKAVEAKKKQCNCDT